MNKTMAEKLIFSNPQIMEAMALEAMKELGMEQVAAMATPERGPVFGQPGAEGGAPRRGNIRNINSLAQDAEMMVAPRSPRAAPGLGR